ncbi:helix-turn-helix transcriptional regulator [Halorussus caseinilyticus]|uniref:Helix-turn-helix transcriptional regulator n=1 Tax=Halorussus caseinilyticus TaxID=3034025 RepID=A0ABD5WMC7_9EURY
MTWQGERDFTDQRPRVKFEPIKGTTTTTTESGDGNATTVEKPKNATQPPTGGDDWSLLMAFIAAVVVLLGLAAAFAWRQGDFGSFSADSDTSGGDGGGGSATAGNGGTQTTEPSVSDEELLTDEARVKKLLDENGGRMKQVNIVEETGWSKSKVSMLLSEMEEDGDISKLRVGRENIISLEGHEPDAAGSPLEGE